MKFNVYPRWNVIFYGFAIGGFCCNFAYGMPYQFVVSMIEAFFKALFMGVGLGSLMVGLCGILESIDTHEKRSEEVS